MSSVDLATAAATAALADTGADVTAVADAIDTVVGLRQFEISSRGPALGEFDELSTIGVQRIGASPGPGGAGTALADKARSMRPPDRVRGAIASGDADAVPVLGSENGSTLRYFAKRDDNRITPETVAGQLEDRGFGYEASSPITVAHRMHGAPAQYGLLENARRAAGSA